MRRRNQAVTYFSDTQECDFILSHLGIPQNAIQVCYSNMDEQKLRDREIGGLIEACKKLKLRSGTLITSMRHETISVGGIKVRMVPLYEWLLAG